MAVKGIWHGLASVAKCHHNDYGNNVVQGGENKEKENYIVEGAQENRSVLLSIWRGGRVSRCFALSFMPSPLAFMCMLTIQTSHSLIKTAWIFCQKYYCFVRYLKKWEILQISILSQNLLLSRFCSRGSMNTSVQDWSCKYLSSVL